MINPDTDLLYFGCWNESGHFLRNRFGRTPDSHEYDSFGGRSLDGAFCPSPGGGRGAYDRGPQVEGSALLHHVDGPGGRWTILAFWDRSVDHRGGCNSAFLAKGEHRFEDMLHFARTYFPSIMGRFKFEIVLYAPGVPTPLEVEVNTLRAGVARLTLEVSRLRGDGYTLAERPKDRADEIAAVLERA